MNPTDDQIHAMLDARAGRASADGLVAAAIGELERAPSGPVRTPRIRWWPRAITAIALVAVLASAFVSLPELFRPPASALPSRSASNPAATGPGITSSPTPTATAAPSLIVGLASARVMTAPELAGRLASSAAAMSDTIVAVQGTLQRASSGSCDGFCQVVVRGAEDAATVTPVGDIGPGPWDGSGPISGTFALKVNSGSGGVVLDFLTQITPATDGLAWTVDDVLDGRVAKDEGRMVVVRGWMVSTPIHPCPSIAPSFPRDPRSQFFQCGREDYLTSESYQPVGPGGGVTGPSRGVYLPSDSYEQFAPEPSATANGGVEPREGNYLLQWVPFGCDDMGIVSSDCFVDPNDGAWFVRGRLESTPTPLRTVAELAARGLQDVGEYTVKAWLVAAPTPTLRCGLPHRFDGVQYFDCSEVEWLTDEPFVPVVGNSFRSPAVGIRVPNGSYVAFAPDPSPITDGTYEPRQGTFVVRRSVMTTCELAGTGIDCLGGPVVVTVIERRLSP